MTPDTESSKDLTTAEQSHIPVKQNLDNTPDTECGCTSTKYCEKHFNESVHKSHPKKTLTEEREAIVDEFRRYYFTDDGEISTVANDVEGTYVLNYLRTALLSHEEKVVARVIEQIKQRPTYHRSSKDWKEALLYSLTLPITDENV